MGQGIGVASSGLNINHSQGLAHSRGIVWTAYGVKLMDKLLWHEPHNVPWCPSVTKNDQ